MDAKEYLMQVKKVDRLIENKLAEIEKMKNIATKVSVTNNGDIVKASSVQDKMANTIVYYSDLEREVDDLRKFKNGVMHIIDSLCTDEMDILYKKYFQNKTLRQIAAENQISVDRSKQVHKKALESVEKVICSMDILQITIPKVTPKLHHNSP